ncbi:ATP-binding protein [Micromonospora cathayae]|uniref:Helix-turn-helix domain-containing protein n=1 Tax=Micromonospora cathayae TaxID=3028804 RepID=A0ABY7ZT59_9ACTN|nr:helix-turn-helix domain-containing protein [Micromonospora sp. HUAS 3]WDZ86068.1 helix-turn-helix domain-containing protein [Micromonospora sp. HUAS 3]
MAPDHDRSRSSGAPAGLPALVRGHRLAAGLTQAELAARAGVGVRTVRDLERGRSSRPQRTTVDLLADALGLTGATRRTFLATARGRLPAAPTDVPTTGGTTGGPGAGGIAGPAADPAGPVSGMVPVARSGTDEATPLGGLSADLPPPVELVGRDHDRAELCRLLAGKRTYPVVSLVGLAGVGKSALALAVTRQLADRYPGGIAGVLVGEGSDVDCVLSAAAAVFGATGPAELATRLGGAPALLLVDAVERAPDAVAGALDRLTRLLPELRVLATGRHPVGLPGERVWPVPPLDVPTDDGSDPEPDALARCPAVRLFVARLAQVRREPPAPEELPALAALVRRLGGLPLAIELMAARGRILDLNELLDRYGHRVLDLAPPPNHREAVAVTLRDAVATSYRLLDPAEQAALRRLAAFRNRWSVGLAEDMLADHPAGSGGDPVQLLDRLLELGLLSVQGTGQLRFRLLDAVRDFAAEQLVAAGEETTVRRRHAEILLRLVARAEPELTGPGLVRALYRLDELTSDILAAITHAQGDDPHTALRLAAGLSRWLRLRGRDVAGRQWLRRLLDDPRTADAGPAVRAAASVGLGRLSLVHGGDPMEIEPVRHALATFQRLGDVAGELDARGVLGTLLICAGAHEEAREQAAAALAMARRHDRVRDMAIAQRGLTWQDVRSGDLSAARRRLASVDRLAGQCGEPRIRALARADLAEVARLEGRYADAVEHGRAAVAALAELGDPGHRRRALGTVGLALAQAGRFDEAGAVLVELRATVPGQREVVRAEDGRCALLEATVALHRGNRELAAEWFAVAAATRAGRGWRDVVESLVGLAASTGDPAMLDRLDGVCRESGIRLLPQEEALLYALTAGR